MKKVNKSFKIRIYPNKEQIGYFNNNFGSTRFVYNQLKHRMEQDYQLIKSKGYVPNLTNRKYLNQKLKDLKGEYDWLKESDSTALQSVFDDLISAFKIFFKGIGNYPVFKSRKNLKKTFKAKMGIKIENNNLKIPKCNPIKFHDNRCIDGMILSVTISNSGSRYYASINVADCDVNPLPLTGREVGLDVGLKNLITFSNGTTKAKLNLKKLEKKLIREQQSLSRKVKGSNNFNRNKLRIQNLWNRITDKRNDYLHKISYNIVKDFDLIVVEDLKVKNMMKNHRLAKNIGEASWYELFRQLKYKSDWYGKRFERVSPNNTSTDCNVCGFRNKELTLAIRNWTCPNCETMHDRDVNASINILNKCTLGSGGI